MSLRSLLIGTIVLIILALGAFGCASTYTFNESECETIVTHVHPTHEEHAILDCKRLVR